MKSSKRLYGTLSLVLALGISCTKDDDADTAATTTATPNSTAKSEGSNIASGALNLAAMPTMTSMLESSTTSFAAVDGTPPVFSTIKPSKLEEFITGSTTEILGKISTQLAKKSGTDYSAVDFTAVDAAIESFRDGETKCRVMADAARQISDMKQQTGSLCYMQNLDKPEETLLDILEGNTEIAAGAFFMAPEGTTTPIVREIVFPDLGDEDEDEGGGGQPSKIRFHITNNANIYKVRLTFCSKTDVATGSDILTIDSNTGTEKMTFVTYHSHSETENIQGQDVEINADFKAVLSAKVKSVEASDGSVSLAFDKDSAREMDMWGNFGSSLFADKFNAEMVVEGDEMDVTFYHKSGFSDEGVSNTHLIKGYSSVNFTGSSDKDIALIQGAGKSVGSFTNGATNETDTWEDSVAFEYQQNSAPKYATTTSSTYLTEVAAHDFSTDEILKLTAPADPTNEDLDGDAMLDDTRCEGTVADGTVDASATFSFEDPKFAAVESKCENEFGEHKNLCDALSQKADTIFSALDDKQAAGK